MVCKVVTSVSQHIFDLGLQGLVSVSSLPELSKALLRLHLLSRQLLLQLQPLDLPSLQLPVKLQGKDRLNQVHL